MSPGKLPPGEPGCSLQPTTCAFEILRQHSRHLLGFFLGRAPSLSNQCVALHCKALRSLPLTSTAVQHAVTGNLDGCRQSWSRERSCKSWGSMPRLAHASVRSWQHQPAHQLAIVRRSGDEQNAMCRQAMPTRQATFHPLEAYVRL